MQIVWHEGFLTCMVEADQHENPATAENEEVSCLRGSRYFVSHLDRCTGNVICPVNLQRAISDVIDPLIPCDELLQCLANIK